MRRLPRTSQLSPTRPVGRVEPALVEHLAPAVVRAGGRPGRRARRRRARGRISSRAASSSAVVRCLSTLQDGEPGAGPGSGCQPSSSRGRRRGEVVGRPGPHHRRRRATRRPTTARSRCGRRGAGAERDARARAGHRPARRPAPPVSRRTSAVPGRAFRSPSSTVGPGVAAPPPSTTRGRLGQPLRSDRFCRWVANTDGSCRPRRRRPRAGPRLAPPVPGQPSGWPRAHGVGRQHGVAVLPAGRRRGRVGGRSMFAP